MKPRTASPPRGGHRGRPHPWAGQAAAKEIGRWLLRLLVSTALAVALGFVPYRLYVRSGLSQYVALRGELSDLREKNRLLKKECLELRRLLERFGEDDSEIERVAREELGLVRSDEVVFKVEESHASHP